jgi:uncharacterized protein
MGEVEPKIIDMVRRFKEQVAVKYGIKRVILFGSAARGEMKKNSDIDLIVVVEKPEKKLGGKLSLEWHINQGIDYPVDFIDYTEREFNEQAKMVTLVSVALKEGIEII